MQYAGGLIRTSLVRFFESGTIVLEGERTDLTPKVKKDAQGLRCTIETAKSSELREYWKRDRRSLPRVGLVFPDGSVLSTATELRIGQIPSSHQAVAERIAWRAGRGVYVHYYSHSFFPNSSEADDIGYFRYDFHPELLNENEEKEKDEYAHGIHDFFHLHTVCDDMPGHVTGPMIEIESIVGMIEMTICRRRRRERIERNFWEARWNDLLQDIMIPQVITLARRLEASEKKKWGQYAHKSSVCGESNFIAMRKQSSQPE